MPKTPEETKTIDAAATAEPIPSADLTLLQTDAVVLIVALEVLNEKHLAATLFHQHEINHPSLMNPQVEMHTTKRDEFAASIEYNSGLIKRIAETFGIETGPTLQVVVQDTSASGVDSPAEHNRPNNATPGLGNSRTI